MNRVRNEGKKIKLFNKSTGGMSKFILFVLGIILGVVSSTLFGYMCGNYNATGNYQYYDWLLFIAIFLLILTGELIGIYFGAYEEYHALIGDITKKEKEIKTEKKEEIIKEEKVKVNNNEKKEQVKKNVTTNKKVQSKPKHKVPKKKKNNKDEKNN